MSNVYKQELSRLMDLFPYNLCWLDKDFFYKDCNDSYSNSLNTTAAQLKGKSIDEYQNSLLYQLMHEKFLHLLKKDSDHQMVSSVFIRNEQYYCVTLVPEIVSDVLSGWFFIEQNITVFKSQEKELLKKNQKLQKEFNKSTAHLQNIINLLPGNVYWKNKESVILGDNINHTKMAGFNHPSEVVGKTDYHFPWKKEAEDIIKNDREVMCSGEAQVFEEKARLSDGELHYFLTTKTPLINESNEIDGVIGISLDITERKKLEKELKFQRSKAESASQAKSDFIANMSHDIRTPITGLVGMMQDLLYAADDAQKCSQRKGALSPTKQNKLLQNLIEHTKQNNKVMLSSIGELLRLCNEILEVTRLESGIGEPSSKAFSLQEVIQHNINLLKPVAEHQNLQLNVEVDKNIPPYLCGLYSYLDRTLLNLMSNSLKFTKKGSVSLLVKLADAASKYKKGDTAKLIIQVKDTGIGIPPDKFDSIFEHFSRLTAAYEGIYKGSGLGLYTVKKYVEAMQGNIVVDSEVGKGTCFTLTLSFIVDDHADISSKGDSSFIPTGLCEPLDIAKTPGFTIGEENNTSSACVLVVEDNVAAGRAVSMGLKRLHCQVDIATTGLEGVEKARQKTYDLILMDIGLPDIDGLEVTRRIRALPADQYKQPPIVALTGHVAENKRADCIASGMSDVVTKPAPPLMLESLLKRFVWQISQDDSPIYGVLGQSTAQKNQELPVIDWEGSVIAIGDDVDLAKQLFEVCSDELKLTKKILEEGYQEKDLEKLGAELHKSLGGVVYLRLPRLEASLRSFQAIIHDEPDNAEKFSAAYYELQDAIQAYQEQWNILQKEK